LPIYGKIFQTSDSCLGCSGERRVISRIAAVRAHWGAGGFRIGRGLVDAGNVCQSIKPTKFLYLLLLLTKEKFQLLYQAALPQASVNLDYKEISLPSRTVMMEIEIVPSIVVSFLLSILYLSNFLFL
jgi:hypothetical protein